MTRKLSDFGVAIIKLEDGPWIFEIYSSSIDGDLVRTGRADTYYQATCLAKLALRELVPSSSELL